MAADASDNAETLANWPASGQARARTGIAGLDVLLGGGVLRRHMYVVEGGAGTGKTTLALQFLLAGRDNNERCLWITTVETPEELRAAAHEHGWSIEGIELLAVPIVEHLARPEQRQTLFRPSHIALDETMQEVLTGLVRVQPVRVVLDSLSILRDMADDPLAYRRQVLALKQALSLTGCTTLVTDELAAASDAHVRTLAHGVVRLRRHVTPFGNQQRQLEIVKMRGMTFHTGRHDMLLTTGGIQVFPRLGAAVAPTGAPGELLSTGLATLDAMLGGGLDRGTATLLVGAAGTGKSSITMQCAAAALHRGQVVAAYLFDEGPLTWFARSEQLGFGLRQQARHGALLVEQIDPAEMSPGHFAYVVQQVVLQRAVRLVILDSLPGYVHAMPDTRFLTIHMHALLTWLSQHDVTTLLVLDQHGLLAGPLLMPGDLSYLADTCCSCAILKTVAWYAAPRPCSSAGVARTSKRFVN
ncbi:MAG: ATPase domain-containing protein [Candidatus Tectimicrobiota bacterium]